MGRGVTIKQKRQIVELYKAGMRETEIQKETGISRVTIIKYLKKAGLDIVQGRPKKSTKTAE